MSQDKSSYRIAEMMQEDFNVLFYLRTGLPDNLSGYNFDKGFAERVIAAVFGPSLQRSVSDIDIQGLANEIWFLREEYPRWLRQDSDAEAKRRHNRLIKQAKLLKEARMLYSQDGPWLDNELTFGQREDFNFIRPLERHKIEAQACGLHALQDAMGLLQSRLEGLIWANADAGLDKKTKYPLLHFTPTRLLVATIARLAKQYLNIEARLSRNPIEKGSSTSQPSGPFIRFAMAVVAEIRADLKPETIAKALQQNRKRESRNRRDNRI